MEPDIPKWMETKGITLDDMDAWGITYPDRKQIILAYRLRFKKYADLRDMVFVHELMHACLPTDAKKRYRICRPKEEERIIEYMAHRINKLIPKLKME